MQEGTYQYPRRNASSFPMSRGAHLPSNVFLLPCSPLPLLPLAHPMLHRERCVGGHVDVDVVFALTAPAVWLVVGVGIVFALVLVSR